MSYGIAQIQILGDYLSITEQKYIFDFISKNSNLLQEKIFLNLIKLPYLIRVIPVCSDIKFDSKRNPNYISKENDENFLLKNQINKNLNNGKDISQNKIFLYNPWEKSDGINYYWTCNSYQKIYVEFFNPLLIDIKVSKIIVLFEGNKPFTFPSKKSFL